jgi:hypothetical protein
MQGMFARLTGTKTAGLASSLALSVRAYFTS